MSSTFIFFASFSTAYQKLHDNLIQSMIHHVRRHGDDARVAAKEQVYDFRDRRQCRPADRPGRYLSSLPMTASLEPHL